MNHINLKNKTVFITGSAGFIGSNLVLELLRTQSPIHIIGLDNVNDYYDVSIKEWRLKEIEKCVHEHSDSTYIFYKDDLANKAIIDRIFKEHKPDIVVNLGAQAGVRYSISNPDAYIQSNMIGFYNILEACRHSYDNDEKGVEHLVYASSSSVYGTNKKVPYSTEDKVDNPVSLYAATKKSNELMAHAYSKLYNIPSTGLRFFTVYGPAGRPDIRTIAQSYVEAHMPSRLKSFLALHAICRSESLPMYACIGSMTTRRGLNSIIACLSLSSSSVRPPWTSSFIKATFLQSAPLASSLGLIVSATPSSEHW